MKRPLKLVSTIRAVPWTQVTADTLRTSEGSLVWDVENEYVEAIPLSGPRKGQTVIIPVDNVASMLPFTDEDLAAAREEEEQKALAALEKATAPAPKAPARKDDTIKLTAADVPGGVKQRKQLAEDPVLDGLVDSLADE